MGNVRLRDATYKEISDWQHKTQHFLNRVDFSWPPFRIGTGYNYIMSHTHRSSIENKTNKSKNSVRRGFWLVAQFCITSGPGVADWTRRWKTALRGCRVRFPAEQWWDNNGFRYCNKRVTSWVCGRKNEPYSYLNPMVEIRHDEKNLILDRFRPLGHLQ